MANSSGVSGSSSSIVEQFLPLIRHVRKNSHGFTGLCPAHPDEQRSLSIAEGGDGQILLKCFAGCTTEAICVAVGIRVADLFPRADCGKAGAPTRLGAPPTKTKFVGTDADVERMQIALAHSADVQAYIAGRGISLTVATDLRWGFVESWTFLDNSGNAVKKPALATPHYSRGQLVGIRFKTIDGTKLYSQMPGSSIDGLYGRWLVHPTAEEVSVFEGPEDCALARTAGLNALALIAASSKVTADDLRSLRTCKRISLVGDMDVAGQRAMDELQKQLPAELIIRVRIPGFKDIGDLHLDNPQKFATNIFNAFRFARAARDPFELDDLLTEGEIQAGLQDSQAYVVDRIVPRNSITMFFGEEKSGKSLLVSYISKCVRNGIAVFGKYPTIKTPVVYFDLENSHADIQNFVRQFSCLGSEPVRYRTRITGCPALDSAGLLRFSERYEPLLVFDSLTKFSGTADPFNPREMSNVFDKLLNLCAAGATVIIIHHATRGDAERYSSSHQIGANVARAYAIVSEDRPRLRRVRMEAKLFRGSEPVGENLIAFPVIAQAGHFGLADSSSSAIESLVDFVRSKGGSCAAEEIKKRKGIRRERSTAELNRAVAEGRLIWKKRGPVSVPAFRNETNDKIPFPIPGTDGTVRA